MKAALQIAPLALMFGAAVVFVWRGMDSKSDRTPKRKAPPKRD